MMKQLLLLATNKIQLMNKTKIQQKIVKVIFFVLTVVTPGQYITGHIKEKLNATFPCARETFPSEATTNWKPSKYATPVKVLLAKRLLNVVVVPETVASRDPPSPVIVIFPPVPLMLFTTLPPPTIPST